jgi:hypothetical protein
MTKLVVSFRNFANAPQNGYTEAASVTFVTLNQPRLRYIPLSFTASLQERLEASTESIGQFSAKWIYKYSRYGSIGGNEYKTDIVGYGKQIRPASHLITKCKYWFAK